MIGTEVDFTREQKALRLLVQETTGAVLAFSLYTERAVRREVTAWLETEIAFPVHTVTLSPELSDPTKALASYPPTPRQCFVFFETEAAFPKFLGYVNFHREELLRSGHALLFWIREEGLRRIAEEAPDFWAWRSRVFDFRTARPVLPLTSAPTDATIGRYSAAELGEQVSSLESSASGDLVTQLALGRRLFALRRYDEAGQILRPVVDIAERTNDERGLAEALFLLGNIALQQDRLGEAESRYERSLNSANPEDVAARAAASLGLAQVYVQWGETERARAQIMRAISVGQALRSPTLLAAAYEQQGSISFAIGDLRQAEQAYLQAIEYGEKVGLTPVLASTLTRLGAVYAEMGDTKQAQQTLQRSAELFRQTGFTDEADKVDEMLGKLAVS